MCLQGEAGNQLMTQAGAATRDTITLSYNIILYISISLDLRVDVLLCLLINGLILKCGEVQSV